MSQVAGADFTTVREACQYRAASRFCDLLILWVFPINNLSGRFAHGEKQMNWLYQKVYDAAHFVGYMYKAAKMGFSHGQEYNGDF